jgi:hypothetical protein
MLTACATDQTNEAKTPEDMNLPKRKIQNRALYRKRGSEFLSATPTVSAIETRRFAHYPTAPSSRSKLSNRTTVRSQRHLTMA